MKIQSYRNFWQRLHKSARNKCFPLRVMFELTYKCNFRCKHCYVPQKHREKKGELKTREVFAILDQLRSIGCFYLGFTGGEPFLRKDIISILRYAKRCGFEIIVYTNASLINERIASELGKLQLNKVDITVPSMTSGACDAVSGVPGSRDRIFKAIDLLHRKGVNLGFKTCLLKENEEEIARIEDFAASLGALHRLDDSLSPRLDGSREPYRYRGRREKGKKEKLKAGKQKTGGLFKCGVGVSQAAVSPFGNLKMCLMIDYPGYRILDLGLKEAWEKLRVLVKNIKPDEKYQCNACELEAYCKWCPARAWLNNRDFTSCDPENRRRAEFLKL